MSPIDTFYAQIIIHFMFKTMKLTFFFYAREIFFIWYTIPVNIKESQRQQQFRACSMRYRWMCVCARRMNEWMNEWVPRERTTFPTIRLVLVHEVVFFCFVFVACLGLLRLIYRELITINNTHNI